MVVELYFGSQLGIFQILYLLPLCVRMRCLVSLNSLVPAFPSQLLTTGSSLKSFHYTKHSCLPEQAFPALSISFSGIIVCFKCVYFTSKKILEFLLHQHRSLPDLFINAAILL